MATYIYVIKDTLRQVEDDQGRVTKLAALTVKDYVSTVREGPGYGTEPSDPRGNLIPLARYLKDVQRGAMDSLELQTAAGTRCALLIFGSLDGGKIQTALASNAAWSGIREIHAGQEAVKCMVADAKFGTQHEKMLMLVASERFNFPKGMKEVRLASKGQRLTPGTLDLYFRSFGY